MKKLFKSAMLAFALTLGLGSAPASAVTYGRSFLASNGNDGMNCQRETPCKTLARAYANANAGGLITCVDRVELIGLVVEKALTIDCDGSVVQYFLVRAQPTDTVTIRGVIVTGSVTNSGPSTYAIAVQSGNAVLDHVHLDGAAEGCLKIVGGKVTISDSVISNCGSGSTGAGILVRLNPFDTGQLSIERVNISGNVFGVAFDNSNNGAGINATIADSNISNNKMDGVVATTPPGGAPIGVLVSNSKSINNGYGIRSIGVNVTVRVRNSDVVGNGTGLSFSGGGSLLTFGNNNVRANGSDGAFSGLVAMQ